MFEKNTIYMSNKQIFSLKDCPGFDLQITGNNNKIYLKSFEGSGKVKIVMPTENNTFEFGTNNIVIRNLNVLVTNAPRCKTENIFIKIGNNNRFQGNVTILSPTGTKSENENKGRVIIGNYNLFAEGIFFHGRQDHLLYDIKTKERINNEASIVLENNIWVGSLVHFLPKAYVSTDSVIGMNSLVNKEFRQNNVLLAGSPAKIKKQNIAWNIYLDDSYLTMETPMEGIL